MQTAIDKHREIHMVAKHPDKVSHLQQNFHPVKYNNGISTDRLILKGIEVSSNYKLLLTYS